MSFSMCIHPTILFAQSTPAADMSTRTTSGNGTSISVSATVAIQISNETLQAKEGLLRSAIITFLNSGPNLLKATPTDTPAMNSKISNQINNVTQIVEGLEATNAIIGVEINKALKTLILSLEQPKQSKAITIGTTSTCKPSGQSIACENVVKIK